MKIEFIGLANKWNSLMFEYRVTIGNESTSYYTGIGHIEKKHIPGVTSFFQVPEKNRVDFAKISSPSIGLSVWDVDQVRAVYRRIPKPSDIAECLLSDINLGSQSFDDFCFNLGYSNDSLKALDTYRACMEMTKKFKRSELIALLTDEQKNDLGITA